MAKQQQQQLSKEEDTDDAPRKCAMWMSKKRRFCAMAPLPTSLNKEKAWDHCGNKTLINCATRLGRYFQGDLGLQQNLYYSMLYEAAGIPVKQSVKMLSSTTTTVYILGDEELSKRVCLIPYGGLLSPSGKKIEAIHQRPPRNFLSTMNCFTFGAFYCGNHRSVAGEKRVPCPIDPSHTILEENVEAHVKKCPATKISKLSELQSYFRQGVNAGCDGEDRDDTSLDLRDSNAAIEPSVEGDKSQSSAAKRKAIAGLSEDQFREFVKRIESAHEVCCLGTEDEEVFQPSQCSKWWDPDRDRRLPFQEKHVSQQASLLGNLEAFGLLQAVTRSADSKLQDDNENWVYVEFGAGRGYLSHMLCDSYGVSSVVLVERSAYKFKADRTLRQILGVSVERLRTDIEDLQLHGVSSLQGRHFVAVSKHLCGPATDLTLRCCLNVNSGISSKPSDDQRCCAESILEGIGIATCCHHLCQWKPYVNKEFFRKLGFSISDFDMMTWLTSWAVNQSGEHDSIENKIMDQEGIRQGSSEVLDSAAQDRPLLSDAMSSLDPLERSVLGRKCKDMLDHGRLLWLKQHGLDVKIVKYISSTITPENKLLLARKCYPNVSPKIAV